MRMSSFVSLHARSFVYESALLATTDRQHPARRTVSVSRAARRSIEVLLQCRMNYLTLRPTATATFFCA
jgi:hypothetical protein